MAGQKAVFLAVFVIFVQHFFPRVKDGPFSVPSFYFMYSIWQDARIRNPQPGVLPVAPAQLMPGNSLWLP